MAHRDDDLSARVARFDVAQGRGRLVQRERPVNNRPKGSGFDELPQHGEVGVARFREVSAEVLPNEW